MLRRVENCSRRKNVRRKIPRNFVNKQSKFVSLPKDAVFFITCLTFWLSNQRRNCHNVSKFSKSRQQKFLEKDAQWSEFYNFKFSCSIFSAFFSIGIHAMSQREENCVIVYLFFQMNFHCRAFFRVKV